MKRRTLFAVALSGILLRASEVLGIEEAKIESPKFDPQTYMGDWVWRETHTGRTSSESTPQSYPKEVPFSESFRIAR